MKKLLLSSVAVISLAAVATPASAQGLKLDLGGHYKGYGVINSQDEATGSEARSVDWLQETEIHFGGETTLDSGLTVGAHFEADSDANDSFSVDESYAYFAGSWGRVNLGDEDGSAYLLQVAAPSADSNVDGIRQFVQGVNYMVSPMGAGFMNWDGFDYDNDLTNDANKLTYLSPIMNGFQAGVSYTPDTQDLASRQGVTGAPGGFANSSLAGVNADDVDGAWGEAYEGAVRYEGSFNNVGVIAGAGYTTVRLEQDGAVAAAAGEDDYDEWNAGLDLDFGAFGLGVVYTENNNGSDTNGADSNETWVVGADYTTGPFKLGVSYLNNENEALQTAGTEVETDRYTGGVVYTYGPGMSFRGSISYIDHEVEGSSTSDTDSTNLLLGTQINF